MSDKKDIYNQFGKRTDNKVQIDYTADSDSARDLINALRMLLTGSAAARRLMTMADTNGVQIRVLKGREDAVYVPQHKWLFMSITPKTAPTPRLALMYAGGLRETEQNILGVARPDARHVDGETWVTQNVVKNADILWTTAQIVDEITKSNQMDNVFLDSFIAMGHDDVYQAYINNMPDEDFIRLYAKKEQLETKEG